MQKRYIRNFSIIAHIDHGKSTLADRLIEFCGGLSRREMKEQVLDSMELERERGITIKAQTVRLAYKARDGQTYLLNLMDTPGHVDFAYEVSRSLAACEGALLVVDASQGVEAQTVANVYKAIDLGCEIIPVLNKIDLPAADCPSILQQIKEVIGIDTSHAVLISAKMGTNIEEVLESIVHYLPPPQGDTHAPLRALLIDSWYDTYLGVIVLVRVFNGVLKKGQVIRMLHANVQYDVEQVGIFSPKKEYIDQLSAGEVGFFVAGIKNVDGVKIGDTIVDAKMALAPDPLPGFKEIHPVVFCSLFPTDTSQFELLRGAVTKLRLNDASFTAEIENSSALGFGFRCGFLGLLHLEIICQRLEREFNLELIITAPSVIYHIHLTSGTAIDLHNPTDMPDLSTIVAIEEPWIEATIMMPEAYLGAIIKLCEERRGIQKSMNYAEKVVILTYKLPLNEVVFDFYDRLKSISRGYASFDYTIDAYQEGDLVKLSILVNGEPIDALSVIVHRESAEKRGRQMCEKLKELIPQQLFKIPIQAAIGSRIIARETISALRKDVTAKCYGGDITRKRKLLEKQKEGKKKMRQFGKVDIPQEAFIAVLKMDH